MADVLSGNYSPSGRLPLRALRGVQRVSLAPGESRDAHFDLKPRDLSSVTPAGDVKVQSGTFSLSVCGGQPCANKAVISTGFVIRGENALTD